jgi:hypothetical protein
MKLLWQVGGVLESEVSMGANYIRANSWPACFWQGCLAAYLAALEMRRQGRSWRQIRQQSLMERVHVYGN